MFFPGYVGADLRALVQKAARSAKKRRLESLQSRFENEYDGDEDVDFPWAAYARWDLEHTTPFSKLFYVIEIILMFEFRYSSSVRSFLKSSSLRGEEGSDLISGLCVTSEDFDCALKLVVPSALKEGFATVPGVTFDDVGALVREDLYKANFEI